MSAPSEEILIQRQLRAAEIALETARRRRFETDEVARALQAEVADVEAALAVTIAARERDREQAEGAVAAAQQAQRVAEQQLLAERHHRLALEQQISALTREGSHRDALTVQLAAETRARQLEGELELVNRRAAEFEYGVRMAVLDALKLVRELADRVVSVLPGGASGSSPSTSVSEDRGSATGGERTTGPAVDSGRLDAALDRLRASAPPPDDDLQR